MERLQCHHCPSRGADDLGVPFGWILAAGKALNHLDNLISDHLKVTSFAARDLLLYTERGRERERESAVAD